MRDEWTDHHHERWMNWPPPWEMNKLTTTMKDEWTDHYHERWVNWSPLWEMNELTIMRNEWTDHNHERWVKWPSPWKMSELSTMLLSLLCQMWYLTQEETCVLTATCSGVHVSKFTDLTLEMCTPKLRCMPAQRIHRKIPIFHDAQRGPANNSVNLNCETGRREKKSNWTD